jgi:hypothetical protein
MTRPTHAKHVPEPIDLVEVEPGVYGTRLDHDIEQMTRPAPAKPAPSYGWLAAFICFFVSAALGTGFVEAVFVGVVGAYVQFVVVTTLRGEGKR